MAMAASTKTADTAVPTMDKRKWTPKSVPELEADDDDGRNPTKRKDVTQPITITQGDAWGEPGKFKEIGEQVTEHQDVTQGKELSHADQGGTFGGGDRSAVSSAQFEGLLSTEAVRTALSKFKRG